MSTTITPGFTGYAVTDLTGTKKNLRFQTCSLNAEQAVEAPDLVMGDYTHNAWAYGKIEVGGSISGPMTENSMDFIDYVWSGNADIDVKYYNGFTRRYKNMWANSLTLNVNAGEVTSFSMDLIGKGFSTTDTGEMDPYTTTEKLLTWDKCALYFGTQSTAPTGSESNVLADLQSFSITITNNITRQFVIRASDLYGDLVRGMSAVTGNLVSYTLKNATNYSSYQQFGAGAEQRDAYANDDYYPIKFMVGPAHYVYCTVVFHRATSELSTGPVLTTLAFTGIGHWGGNNLFTPEHSIIGSV